MTDQNAGQPDPAGAAGGQPMMLVNAQYLKDFSFENPNAPQSLQQTGEPNIQIAIDVNVGQVADKAFEVTLAMRAEGKTDETTLFIVEIAYAGIFSLGEVQEEHMAPLLYIEAPRQLFPFARAIIADAVRDGGFPPLMIQPVDFVAIFQQRVAQAQASQQASGGDAPAPGAAPVAAPAAAPAANGGEKKGGGDKFEFEL
ncbi:MAG: protein-export chaperone SecB [Alphaproteobacteria bacterium]